METDRLRIVPTRPAAHHAAHHTARYAVRRAACRAALLGAGLLAATAARAQPALMPMPQSASVSDQSLPIAGGIAVDWQTPATPLLRRALARFSRRLQALSGSAVVLAGTSPAGTPILHIRYGRDPAWLSVRAREAYRLSVAADGVSLAADGPAGVIHGLATLLQLVQPASSSSAGASLAMARIDDAPRFPWRGLMIDVSRHFMSVDTIERQLDAMELTKLNVLHWHLSDGTGFRVESRLFPKLQQIGGHHQYYTQAQIRAVVAYAADRGIRIVPEFDIPGHTLAILEAYPELAAQQPVPLTPGWHQTCATESASGETTASCAKTINLNNPALDPTRPQTLRFARALYAEMGRLFPDRYFHSGGDEVSSRQWTANPRIVAYMKAHGFADAPALQAAFTAQVQDVLAAQGKIMMGWDEVSEAPIPKNVVVEAWRSSKWIASATRAGHPVVVSSGYYLDLLRPSAQHYRVDPMDPKADGLSPQDAIAARPKMGALVDAFTIDPHAPPLDTAQQALVLGGEAPLWSEVVSDEMVDARLWPRSAAIAERFWSPAGVHDVADMERRLPAIQHELEVTGLAAGTNTDRMIALLTPADVTPLTILTSVTVPVRNYGLNRLAAHGGDAMLKAPAAIAAPDSFAAMDFNGMAARYAAGDHAVADTLRARLIAYAGNDMAYARIATTPALQAARPVSRQLAALALLGLEAMEPGRHGQAWRAEAARQFAVQDRAYESCAHLTASDANPLPPGGLLIAIVPGIRALVDAAP